jgi:hypothetical protein
VFRVVLFR